MIQQVELINQCNVKFESLLKANTVLFKQIFSLIITYRKTEMLPISNDIM